MIKQRWNRHKETGDTTNLLPGKTGKYRITMVAGLSPTTRKTTEKLMLVITQRQIQSDTWDAELILTFELRSKSRLRTRAENGEEVGLFLTAGQPLQHGEIVQAQDGRLVKVLAKPEPLLHVTCTSDRELTRAAYHLGNRHVHLQVGEGWLRLLQDSVLEAMLVQLGATVIALEAPFDPETGAYGGGHHHSHGKDEAFQYEPKLHVFGNGAKHG